MGFQVSSTEALYILYLIILIKGLFGYTCSFLFPLTRSGFNFGTFSWDISVGICKDLADDVSLWKGFVMVSTSIKQANRNFSYEERALVTDFQGSIFFLTQISETDTFQSPVSYFLLPFWLRVCPSKVCFTVETPLTPYPNALIYNC